MRLEKVFIILFYSIFVISFLNASVMEERRGRPYDIGRDIGFRWRTTLSVKCGSTLIDSDAEHSRLKAFVTGCDPIFYINNANVAATSLQVLFKDSSCKLVPEAITYTRYLEGVSEKTRVSCFSTACLTVGEGSQARHPPITYKNRETLEYSIPFIFGAIGMNADCVKSATSSHFQYDYRDTEF